MNINNPALIEPLHEWVEFNRPSGWEDWEWHKFMCALARIYLVTAADTMQVPVSMVIQFLQPPGDLEH